MKDLFRKVILILISVLFSLLLGEGLLQLTFRVQNGQWVWEANAFKYDYMVPVDDRRAYAMQSSYYDEVQNIPVNERGERETQQSVELKNNPNALVCLGDSVPFGAGIGNDDTYPFHLADLFSKKEIEHYVINAGVPSYNLRQSFDRLHFDIFQHLAPTRVKIITLQAANDISLLLYYRENWNLNVTWADARFNISPVPGSNYLAISHYISQLISQPKGSNKEFDPTQSLNEIKEMLREEAGRIIALNNDVKIILLPVNPFYYQIENTERNEQLRLWDQYYGQNSNIVKSRYQLVRDINQILEDVSTEYENLYFLDLRVEMDRVDRDALYIDYIHLSSEGAQLQAQLVLDYLLMNDLILIGQ